MDVLKKLFEEHFHVAVEKVQPLQGNLGASGRNILRLAAGKKTAIGILYGVREENVAFLSSFRGIFGSTDCRCRRFMGEELEQGAYLEEDLGDTTLFEFLSKNRSGEKIAPEVDRGVPESGGGASASFRCEAGRDLNYKVCYPRGSFDRQSIAWDLNYFKYYFLRLAGIPFSEQALEEDFGRLTKFLLAAPARLFFVSRFSVAKHHAARREAVFPGLPGWAQGRAAVRHCFAFV